MATTKKVAKKATKAKAKAKAKAKKPAKKPAAPKKAEKAEAELDRKGLAARARQLKSELLAIRFNIQAPNLTEYRKKRRELSSVLAQLG